MSGVVEQPNLVGLGEGTEWFAFPDGIKRASGLSDCGTYRYSLGRRWTDGPLLPFVMLNPSTADADVDDPTIRRCMGFARREGAAGIVVGNLFALRSTDPWTLLASPFTRTTRHNELVLLDMARRAAMAGMPIVCAWGAHEAAADEAQLLLPILRAAVTKCLGITKAGHPRHPLYVRADQPLVEYAP